LRLHVLVEGPSEATFLRGWFPRFLPRHALTVIQHRGKGRLPGEPASPPNPRREGLLDQLPAKLRAYGRALNPATDRVLVFLDLDADDCGELKERLLRVLDACEPRPVVLFRIAIEETEAFYLGDPQAIKKAFPQANLRKLKSYVQTASVVPGSSSARSSGLKAKTKCVGPSGWPRISASSGGEGERIRLPPSNSSARGF
jgi:Domain of unknown function (DUF4276)